MKKDRGKPYCCQIDCNNDATHEIVFGTGVDDYTHSCKEHIEEMKVNDNDDVYPLN